MRLQPLTPEARHAAAKEALLRSLTEFEAASPAMSAIKLARLQDMVEVVGEFLAGEAEREMVLSHAARAMFRQPCPSNPDSARRMGRTFLREIDLLAKKR